MNKYEVYNYGANGKYTKDNLIITNNIINMINKELSNQSAKLLETINEKINNYLYLRKFNIKSNYLTKRYFDIEKFENCFPEAKYSWRGMGYSFRECVKFWLAENKLYYIIKLLS